MSGAPPGAAAGSDLDRRALLRSLALGLAAVPLSGAARAWQEVAATAPRTRLLSASQLALLAEVCERIVPRTDTPGAKDAQVHYFADVLLADWVEERERDSFLAGLADVDRRCGERFGVSFTAAVDAQRDELLRTLEDEAIAQRQGRPFTLQPESVEPPMLRGLHVFDVVRWMTLVGYYTSEVGMNEELSWQAVPGPYDGCAAG